MEPIMCTLAREKEREGRETDRHTDRRKLGLWFTIKPNMQQIPQSIILSDFQNQDFKKNLASHFLASYMNDVGAMSQSITAFNISTLRIKL